MSSVFQMHRFLQAVLGKHSNLKDVLSLFLRDDILGWSARRSGRPTSASNVLPNEQLAELVHVNVNRALERLASVRAHAAELHDKFSTPLAAIILAVGSEVRVHGFITWLAGIYTCFACLYPNAMDRLRRLQQWKEI